jgi:hypothetical protein
MKQNQSTLPDTTTVFSLPAIAMTGIASVPLLRIAYHFFFFRQGKGVPEHLAEPSISDFGWCI